MKILLVSKDLREADFLDHEVKRILPAVHFDVQHDLQNVEKLQEQGHYDALLLDASIPRTQSLQIIAALREHDLQLPVLVLADTREENNPEDLLRTVADEWIPKKPGFITALTGLLRRIKAHEPAEPESEQPEEHQESLEPEQKQADPKDSVDRSDNSTILEELRQIREKNAALEDTLRQTEGRQAQLIEERRVEQEHWELAHQGLKEQGAWIENVVRTLRAKHVSLLEKHRAEQQKWESTWKDADQRRQEAESRLAELKASRETTLAHQAQIDQENALERSRLQNRILELEQQIRQVRDSEVAEELASAQTRETRFSEEYRMQTEQLEYARLELDQARRNAASEKAGLESALKDAGNRYSELLEQVRNAEAQWESERESLKNALAEAEDRRSRTVAALESLEAAQAETVRDIGSLQLRWEQERADLEARYKAASQESSGIRSALETAQVQKEVLTREIQGERQIREKEQQEWERKEQDWETERERLSAALRETEQRINEQIQEAQKPRPDFDQMQQERDRLWKQLREDGSRYERLLSERVENFERLLGETVSQLRKDEEERLGLISERHRNEVESLERALHTAREENQQLSNRLQVERDRLQAELAHLGTRYQRLTDTGASGVIVATLDGVVVRCNDAAAKMFGFPGQEEELESATQLAIFRGGPAFQRALQENGSVSGVEWALQGKDGGILRLRENATVLGAGGVSETGTLVERIFSDVTHRHQVEDDLARVEAVREIATAAVQSFNEVCASLSHNSGLLASSMDPEDPRHASAERLVQEAGSAIKLARQFLSFVRRESRAPESIDVNGVILESEVLLRNLAGSDVDFESSLAPHLGPVMADRRELLYILTKLASTSREAMPMGGTLTIETAETGPQSFPRGQKPELNFGAQVVVRVSAAGCGIQAEKRTAALKQLVERAGGRLEISSDPVAGNAFQLFLPRVLPIQ
jgi:DNA-binding NarL/FixJ family response regulator